LRANVDQLPPPPSVPEEVARLVKLIYSERNQLPELFIKRQCTLGEVICQEDDLGDSMFIIQSGRLAVAKGDLKAPIVLGCRYPGEAVGEMALLEDEPRSATLVAIEDCQLLEINRENFHKLLGASPSFSQGIMRLLSSRLREASEAVERETMAKIRDPLTGLYNRRFMEGALEQELLRAARADYPVSLILMDIDLFKSLNDTYGHPAGDEMLRRLGELIFEHVRRADVACRYGGEEFLIILPETELEIALQRADQLRVAFASMAVDHNGKKLQRTISIGVSAYPNHGATPSQLILTADKALYQAKVSGRDRVIGAEID
jgi:diguanylate cyclase (GGDEF)-like protein